MRGKNLRNTHPEPPAEHKRVLEAAQEPVPPPAPEPTPDGHKLRGSPLKLNELQAMLYLADQLAKLEEGSIPRDQRIVDRIADALNIPTFRVQPWCREFTEASALSQLRSPAAKTAALTVLALVLKTDVAGRASGREIFKRIRQTLGAEPVTVPGDTQVLFNQVVRMLRPLSSR